MSADSPRRSSGNTSRGMVSVPTIVPPQVVSDRSILDSAIGFINEVTLAHQPHTDPKDTITWARFETAADISDPRFGEDWELDGNVAPPLLLILGYGLGVQVWAIPANGEAVEVLSWRYGIVSALRVLPTPSSSVAIEENGRADEPIDIYAEKRPLIALVDGSSSSGSQPQFCAVNFISLKTGTQVKTIKFKNPVIDVLANRSSIVITFHERIAVFDARTLEDRLSITTCYPSPGINPNPIALGHRWLAYAEHKLLHSKRSGGGCDGEGVASYTATVLNASKSLVKGLRELGEQVAAGLTGNSPSGTSSKNTSFDSGTGPESKQSGVVTIIDVKNPLRDFSPTSGVPMSSASSAGTDPIVAHFIAHSEALVAMEFDNSGMLLVTADRRGHDFHVFRIQPNPVGPSLAAVHHLYVLHRGDTSAKVQNISFSLDSRWVAVSTLRGTTHVFPITPYGGAMSVRTHTSLHVVNKLSRFHRSAGLSAEGRSNSPISHSESTTFSLSLQPYHNTTLPPYPRPTVVIPLAQLRQPFALGTPPGSATLAGGKTGQAGQGSGSQRQRLSSLSDDSGKPLSVCAIFAKSRSWLLDPPNVTREAPHRMQRKAVDSLFVMAGHGALIQYDLDTKLASNVAKEKICDDTPIELEVEAKAQWNLGRRKEGSQEIMPPLTMDNWLVKSRNSCMLTDSTRHYDDCDDRGESWLAQVEIVTHAGPHRRLWMGPQFVFKTYNTPSGSNLSHVDIEAVEIGTNSKATTTTAKPEHSSPLNMPLTAAGRSSAVPVLIESGSYSSIEQSPKLMDRFRHDHLDSDFSVAHGDTRLKEDLADAMRESPSVSAASKDSGGRGCESATATGCSNDNIAFYDALADHDDQDQDSQDQDFAHNRNALAAALASALPNIYSYDNSSSYESSVDSLKKPKASIEKIVNPLGTVTTVTSCLTADVKTDILDEVVSQLAAEDTVIHENCDESLFRPVVAIFCDEKTLLQQVEEDRKTQELCQPPENIGNKLVVPVIEKEVDDELNKREKQKYSSKFQRTAQSKDDVYKTTKDQSKFEELSALNKRLKDDLPVGAKDSGELKENNSKSDENKEQLKEIKEKTTEKKSDVKENITKKSQEDTVSKRLAEPSCLSKESVKVIKESEKAIKESVKVIKESDKGKESEETDNKLDLPKAKSNVKQQSKVKEDLKTSVVKEINETAKLSESPNVADKPEDSQIEKTTTAVVAKDKAKASCEKEKETELKSDAKQFSRETDKSLTGIKPKKASTIKETTPERELSPKRGTKKTGKACTADESEEEKPVEFMRMTPTREEKTTHSKSLTKKEIKKQQQQQKAQEEAAKQSEIEKSKKKTEKEQEQKQKIDEVKTKTKITDNNKRENDNIKDTPLGDVKEKVIIAKENKNNKIHVETSKIYKEEANEGTPPLLLNKSDNKTTACETLDRNDQEPASSKSLNNEMNSKKCETQVVQEPPMAVNKPLQTALKIKISAIDKTAIKEEIENTPKLITKKEVTKTEVTKPAKTETLKSNIKTEKLNVKDLADSLIETQDEETEDEAKAEAEAEAKSKAKEITKQAVESTTPPMETVDIFTAPSKPTKKNKKTGNKSGSSSETDEIIEIVKPLGLGSLDSIKPKPDADVVALKKKSSTSSEESYTDLADSLLDRKSDDDLKETMFISFKQIEENRKLQEKKNAGNFKKPTSSKESEKDLHLEGKYSKGLQAATKKQQDIKNKEKKEQKETVKNDGILTKGNSKPTIPMKDINVLEKCEEKITNKPEECLSEDLKEQDENSKIKEKPETLVVEPTSKSKFEEEVDEDCTTVEPTNTSKFEEGIDDECSKSMQQFSEKNENDKNNSVALKKTSEKTKKSEESDKVKAETLKKTAEKTKETQESAVSSNKPSSSEGSDKDKSVILSKSARKASVVTGEESDKKKAEASKKSEAERKNKSEQDRETLGKETCERKSKESKLDDDKDLQKKILAKEKSSQLVKESVSRSKNENDKELKKPDVSKKGNFEKGKSAKPKEGVVVEQPRMRQSKELEKEEVITRYEKDTTTKRNEELEIEELITTKRNKELKKAEIITPCEKDTTTNKNNDKDVERHRKDTATNSNKDKVVERHGKDATINRNSNNDSESHVVDDSKDSLKSKNSPTPATTKRDETKSSKIENVKTDTTTSNRSAGKVAASKEPHDELSKSLKKKSEVEIVTAEVTKKPTNSSKQDAKKEEKTTKLEEPNKVKTTEESLTQESAKKSLDTATTPLSPILPPVTCAWKTLSGAEMIAKNLAKKESRLDEKLFPSLGAIAKSPKTVSEKLLPELPTPKEMKESLGATKTSSPTASKKTKSSPAIDDFPMLQALEPLPPLPTLEPLELLGEIKNSTGKDISLINFESPLQENPALERKITPPPRGFTEQNIIFALCGSLHYENEQRSHATPEKSDASSSNRSSSAMDEPSMADYKSLTENDDPYVSLEQSSQDTNTTNTNTTNDKFSSSNNSSGTEEIIIMEEKKMTKKQKRKRQQQLLELQKQKEIQIQQQHHQHHHHQHQHDSELDDEELRPLIAMSESQITSIAARVENAPLPSLLDDSFSMKPLITKSNTLTYYTTTDSEGPMPVTTSDDNVFIMPSSTTTHSQHKIKTKKMEHKFNLIAAIEAATSSSTSSAEESGVEMGGAVGVRALDNDDPPQFSLTSMISAAGVSGTASAASSVLPIPMSPVVVGAAPISALSPTVGALKKKTKRRFQFQKDHSDNSTDTTDGGIDKMRNQLNHKKSTTDMSNSTHDSNATTTTTVTSVLVKQKSLEKKSLLSQDPTLPPQQPTTDTHKSIYEMKQQQQQQQQQYLTNNAMDNCFANPDVVNLEAATIVNIDIFDDQLSTSSLSNASRFSCENTPLTTTTPPISLNGVIDTNLMHFSQNTTAASVVTKGQLAAGAIGGGGVGNEKHGTATHYDNNRLSRHGGGGGGAGGSGGSAEEDEDDDNDDNSSNTSAGSL